MKILILLLSASLFLSTFTSYQEQESPELKEAIDLTNSLVKLFNEGKYDEALPLAKRALQIREKLLPRTDARVSNALVNLAEVYLAKKDYNSAKQAFERALPLQEERFGPTSEKLGLTLDRLAVLYHYLGNMSKAETMYQRALVVREEAFGPENVKVAEPLFHWPAGLTLSSRVMHQGSTQISIYANHSRGRAVEGEGSDPIQVRPPGYQV